MSKSIDLGKTYGDSMISPVEVDKDKKHYPDLYISEVDDARLADIPDKGECTITYRVCSKTHRQENEADSKKKNHTCSLRLEILSITPPESKKNGKGYGEDARKSFSDYFKDK